MILKEFNKYLETKIAQNPKQITFTYYELRVKCDLSEDDMLTSVRIAKQELENQGYKTYEPGASYFVGNQRMTVKENQLLIGIKE